MNFDVPTELGLFAGSTRAALEGWQPPREPDFGAWRDDRDDALAARLATAGWGELWAGAELLGPAVAGGIELGRVAAPICLVDEATLGAPLWVDGRARHGRFSASLAVPEHGGGLGLGPAGSEARPEPTLDGSGTVAVDVPGANSLEPVAATACWRAWNAATLAYLAGLAARALELALAHSRAREQFGAPLATIPAVQSRLVDAALAADEITLLAWAAASNDEGIQDGELRWAGATCCEVTASAHQVHGALGFALESGVHVYYRRARAVHTWTTAACDALRGGR
jgi:Acyl-CoA dehydrogenase, C-terminal domain